MKAFAIVLVTLFTFACAAGPTEPTPPLTAGVGSQLTLTVSSSAILLSGSTVTVSARARTERGDDVAGQLVTFTTNAGTLSGTAATTDSDGVARVTLTASAAAYVTASTANAAQAVGIPAQAPFSVSVAPAGPVTVHHASMMLVTVTPAAGVANAPAPSSVAVACGPSGGFVTLADRTGTCTFGSAGPSMVRVSASSANGWQTTGTTAITVDAAVLPPTPPPPLPPNPIPAPTLRAAVFCTGAVGSRRVTCNITDLYYGGQPVPIGSITEARWDWGDGDSNVTLAPSAATTEKDYDQNGAYTLHVTVTAHTEAGLRSTVVLSSVVVPIPARP